MLITQCCGALFEHGAELVIGKKRTVSGERCCPTELREGTGLFLMGVGDRGLASLERVVRAPLP